MPINRVPFNALVDDSGNGLTGSIWNKAAIQNVILDPVDAAILPVYIASFTPVNGTAGLSFAGGTAGTYAKIDKLIFFWCQLFWPSTANAGTASFSLPVVAGFQAGLWQGFGPAGVNWYIQQGTGAVVAYNTSGAPVTNATLSAANVVLSGVYRTA